MAYSLVKGSFSLWAPRHLIKQAQEMSLLADWPCVFLHRRPSGTADTLGGPGPASRMATLTFPRPIDIDAASAPFTVALAWLCSSPRQLANLPSLVLPLLPPPFSLLFCSCELSKHSQSTACQRTI